MSRQSREAAYESSLNSVQRDPVAFDAKQDMTQDEIDHILRVVQYEDGEYDALRTIADALKRPGFVLGWKSKSCLGNTEMQKAHLSTLQRRGWRFVDGARGKGYTFVDGDTPPATVEYGAMILMERPKVIDDAARQVENIRAQSQLNDKLTEIGHNGTRLGPINHSKVQTTMEAGTPVPD